jgi:hypothetical protein
MAKSIINADTEGLKTTGGDTAQIEIQTNGLPAITVDSGQNWVLANPLSVASGGTGSTTASFSGANITSLNASNISSGVLAVAQGGTGSATASFSGANITSLNASNISSGTVGTARLGSGTANNTTYLRGDQTWQTISATPSTADVLNATAGASAGAVGTYAFLGESTTTNTTFGSTRAGSALFSAGAGKTNGQWNSNNLGTMVVINTGYSGVSGTWRCMGNARYDANSDNPVWPATLWLRIS